MKKILPIGVSDFEEIITQNYYFADKSLLIKELLDSKAKVTLIPRPRRFGKTLNLSMIRYFFEKTEKSKTHLFDNLKISKEAECIKHQEQYPVIFLTFKDVKDLNWNKCYQNIQNIISKEFKRHDYLLKENFLTDLEKNEFNEIISKQADQSTFESSLQNLSTYLHRYYKKKVIMLIDEYDAAIHSGFINKYYDEVINFMRIFLSSGIKDNYDLEFCVITGILRVAKESIFSGLNNLEVCTLTNNFYADKFGLLEDEVLEILNYYSFDTKKIASIKLWYDGYNFGNKKIYNPWSIINYIKQKNNFQPYWINTSSNDIIKELVLAGSTDLKNSFEILLEGKTITQAINETIVFNNLDKNSNAVWNFFLFSGYLTFNNLRLEKTTWKADFSIPNLEIKHFFETTVLSWFEDSIGNKDYEFMLKSLVNGDISTFRKIFTDFIFNSFSYFDVSGKDPERVYHAFVLGMLVSLGDQYEIKSNKESGYGRYDVMIIPKDLNKPGIIIEFKKVDTFDKETLETAAQNALKQIDEKQYEQELLSKNINPIYKLGIAFEGKKVLVLEK